MNVISNSRQDIGRYVGIRKKSEKLNCSRERTINEKAGNSYLKLFVKSVFLFIKI